MCIPRHKLVYCILQQEMARQNSSDLWSWKRVLFIEILPDIVSCGTCWEMHYRVMQCQKRQEAISFGPGGYISTTLKQIPQSHIRYNEGQGPRLYFSLKLNEYHFKSSWKKQ